MGIKGLRPPGSGPNRSDLRSAKHRYGISGGVRQVATMCVVHRPDGLELAIPLTIKEIRELVLRK